MLLMGAKSFVEDGVPEGNRTPDPRFRKPVLYPAELPGLEPSATLPEQIAIDDVAGSRQRH
jgi:hypothetical protein